MKYIISFSGGVGSAMSAELAVEKYGKENVLLLFADTLIEDGSTYAFIESVADMLDVPLVRLADGRTPWEVFEDVKFIGNSRIDPCSRLLKRDLLNSWVRNNFSSEECHVIVGIDCTEEHRLHRVVEANRPYVYRSLLIENDIFVLPTMKKEWAASRGVELPRLYALGFAHNNCGGFCIKAGLGQFKLLWEKLPERYAYHEAKEQEAMSRNPKLRPFLKKVIKGQVRYLTLRQYREEYLEQDALSAEEKQEFGGCGCAIE